MARKVLSPHLTIYKPQISSVLSILHRITGVVAYLGLLALLWLLVFLTYVNSSSGNLDWLMNFDRKLVLLVVIAWSYSIFYHLCNGIRYLFWGMGVGFAIPTMEKTGWLAIIGSLLLTAVSWYLILR
jgi:succinate dehydrogenase / fumarate reductase cytochrome b subunit